MEEKLITYKATDKDMKCYGGFQYELGKTVIDNGAVRCGGKGFHSCEAPFDVARYGGYGFASGARYFQAEAGGEINREGAEDTKLASSELTLKAEIGLKGLMRAQIEYTRKKAMPGGNICDRSNLAGGDWSNLAGGAESNLAGGNRSNIAGGDWSNLAGGNRSNLAGGGWSNLAGGDWSNLAGGYGSNLAGGNRSNIAGGDWSNLAGGNRSNLAGGDWSNLAGGAGSLIVGRSGCRVKAGIDSVIVLTDWGYQNGALKPIVAKAFIVDGEAIKADTWYVLKGGELVEADE